MLHSGRNRQVIVLGSLLGNASAAAVGCGSDDNKVPTIDATKAMQGKDIFRNDTFRDETFTDANSKLHAASEVVSEPEPNGAPSYASRSATKQYRTAPLRGLWQHPPYFHNGSAATLEAVVDVYDMRKSLGLTAAQKGDLVQYLKSL